jgi:hypothetical protein
LALLLPVGLLAQDVPAQDQPAQDQPADQAAQDQVAQDQVAKPQTSFTGPVSTRSVPVFSPLSNEEKFHHYLHHTFGPARILRSGATAGINQWMDSNPEWGQGMEGYGRRFGSKLGQSTIKRTLQLGIGIWRDEDPRYFRSVHDGFWLRTRHALAYTFVTRMDDGSKGMAVSRLTSTFGASLLSRTWQPERKRTVKDGLQNGVISLGIDAAFRIVQEFWPDIRHRFRR